MPEATIRLHVEPLDEGGFVATSPDVPGLVVQGETLVEVAEIARDVALKIAESCIAHGFPVPPALETYAAENAGVVDLLIPIGVY